MPLALLYDKLLLLVAIGWLLREAHAHGFLPWEKLVLLLTWPASLVTWVIGTGLHVPLGPVITGAVLILCVRRVWLALSAQPRQAASAPVDTRAFGATS